MNLPANLASSFPVGSPLTLPRRTSAPGGRHPEISILEALNGAFQHAIEASGYQGEYRGVFPIKVNQQQQVIEEITEFGRRYHYGLEAGSRPELLAALAYMHDPEALLICNDQETPTTRGDTRTRPTACHAGRDAGIQPRWEAP